MSDFQPNMKESRMIISQLSFKVMRRVPANGVISQQDVEQELWIAWCAARDAFNPDMGVPFGAYLRTGLLRHINRMIEKNIWRFREQTFAKSLDAKVGEGEGSELHEFIASPDETPAQSVEAQSCYQEALRRLSDRARIFVSLLHDQPQDLVQEVMLAQDKAEHAKKLGAPYAQPKRITASIIFDLMGASSAERKKITTEVEKVGERISR